MNEKDMINAGLVSSLLVKAKTDIKKGILSSKRYTTLSDPQKFQFRRIIDEELDHNQTFQQLIRVGKRINARLHKEVLGE